MSTVSPQTIQLIAQASNCIAKARQTLITAVYLRQFSQELRQQSAELVRTGRLNTSPNQQCGGALLTICEPFQWYLVVTCKECGTRQPINRDPSRGATAPSRRHTWECIECDNIAVYQVSEIERYYHKFERRKFPR